MIYKILTSESDDNKIINVKTYFVELRFIILTYT